MSAASILYLYVLAATLVRVLPHPWNMTPVGAMFLFSAATFRSKWQGWLVPLASLMITDYAVVQIVWHGKFAWFSPYTWGAFSIVSLLGWTLRSKTSVLRVAGVAASGSVTFWLLSDFAVWAVGHTYPHTLAGLGACYVAAIPFFPSDLAGNLVYCGIMFGSYAYVQNRQRALVSA
jgi:hypothetical protein